MQPNVNKAMKRAVRGSNLMAINYGLPHVRQVSTAPYSWIRSRIASVEENTVKTGFVAEFSPDVIIPKTAAGKVVRPRSKLPLSLTPLMTAGFGREF
jgi:hypothetical protein